MGKAPNPILLETFKEGISSVRKHYHNADVTPAICVSSLKDIFKACNCPFWQAEFIQMHVLHKLEGKYAYYVEFHKLMGMAEEIHKLHYPSLYREEAPAAPQAPQRTSLKEYSDEELLKELRRRHPGNEVLVANDTHYPVMVPYNKDVEIITRTKVRRNKA